MDNFTKDDVDAAISVATDALKAELEATASQLQALKGQSDEAIVDARVAEVQAEVAQLQTQLDEANIQLSASTGKYDELVTVLNDTEASRIAAEEAAVLRESRVGLIKDAGIFTEDHIEANAERWTKLDDETFEAMVESFKELSTAAKAELPTVGVETAMDNTRKTGSGTSMQDILHSARTSARR